MRNRSRIRYRTLGLLAAGLLVALAVRVGTNIATPEGETAGTRAAEESAEATARGVVRREPRDISEASRSEGSDGAAQDSYGVEFSREEESPSGESASAGSRPSDSVAAIELDPFRGPRAASTLAISGRDPDAPRDLLAWRMSGGRFAIVARGQSERDGTLRFPEIIAPRDGMEIVVTGTDGLPGLPGASDPQQLRARDLVPPRAHLLATEPGRVWIRITPAETTGSVLVADAYGGPLGRFEVPATPNAADRVFDVPLSVAGESTQILLAHELADGRASEWVLVDLPVPEAAAAGAD